MTQSLLTQHGLKQNGQAIPGDLDSDAKHDERDDTQNALGRCPRDFGRNGWCVRIAKVDQYAYDYHCGKYSRMTEQICAEFAARYVGAKREHRNERSGAGSNRKCERIEEFRFEIVKSRVAWLLRFVFLPSHAPRNRTLLIAMRRANER